MMNNVSISILTLDFTSGTTSESRGSASGAFFVRIMLESPSIDPLAISALPLGPLAMFGFD
jgi:hypothetical protein